jgi:hypothetical protein
VVSTVVCTGHGSAQTQRAAKPQDGSAQTQSAAKPQDQTAQIIQTIRDDYYRCVRRSGAVQLGLTPDANLAAEQAFLACKTEERLLRNVMAGFHTPPVIADLVVLTHQRDLKTEIIKTRR